MRKKNGNINLKKLNLYSAHILVFLIPFHAKAVVIALIAFLVLNVFAHSPSDRLYYFKKRGMFILLFSLFYLIHIAGLFYSDNTDAALFDLEVKLSILVVPLVVLTGNVINKFTLPELLRTFVYGTVAAAALSFFYAAIVYLKTGQISAFYYGNLAYYHHPSYFAMYLNFSVSILIIFIFNKKNRILFFHYLMLAFLIVAVYHLSSRMGIIVTTFLIAYVLTYLIAPKIKYKNPVLALLGVLLISGGIIYVNLEYVERFQRIKTSIIADDKTSSSMVRLSIWNESLKLIAEKPLFGHGTGDVKDVLVQKYEESDIATAFRKHYNAHNQYLQIGIGAGITGVLCLTLPWIIPLFYLKRKRNVLYGLFIFNVGMNCLTESVLERQDGVIFYAVFNAFLFFTYKD